MRPRSKTSGVRAPKLRAPGERLQDDEAPGIVHPSFMWFAFLGPAAAWALQFSIGYGLTEIACNSDRLAFTVLGTAASAFLSLLVTLVAGLTAFSAGVIAYLGQPSFVDGVERPGAPEATGRSRFMAYTGVVMSGLFLLAILSQGLVFFFLRPC